MSLDLYLGPMFAGKSSAVLGVIRRNAIIGRKTLCITHCIDNRYSEKGEIISHNRESAPAIPVQQLLPVAELLPFRDADCVIIEEAQFFPDLKPFVLEAVESFGKHVICVGLDGDSDRRPFGQLLDLIPYCDKVQKFTALCAQCANGTEAIFTFRKPGAPTTQVAVGGHDTYEPLCRHHFLEFRHQQSVDDFVTAEVEQQPPALGHAAIEQLERCVARFGPVEGSQVYQRIMAEAGAAPSLR